MAAGTEDEVVGLVGRISIPVAADKPGEIIVNIRGGSEAFTAYTVGGEALEKNARAAVVERTGARTVLVTGY